MMSWMRFYIRSVGIVIGIFTVATCHADDAVKFQHELLSATIERFRNECEFVANFRYLQDAAKSYEDALAGRFAEEPPFPEIIGTLYKRSHEVRLRFQPEGPLGTEPFDEATNQVVQIRHMIRTGNAGGSVYLTLRPRELAATPLPGILSRGLVTPLSPFGGFEYPIVPILVKAPPKEGTFRLVRLADERKEYSHHVLQPSGERVLQIVRVRQVEDFPRIEEMDLVISGHDETGKWRVRRSVRLSDFRAVPGGQLPAKVIRVMESRSGKISLTVWESSDLGKVEVTDRHFVFDVPAGLTVAGLHEKANFHGASELSPKSITPDMLGNTIRVIGE